VLQILSPSPLGAYKPIEQFTPLRLLINEAFNTINDQLWVRRPRPIQYDPSAPRVEEYCSTMTVKGTRPSIVGAFESTWKSSSVRTSSMNVLTSEAASGFGQPSALPST